GEEDVAELAADEADRLARRGLPEPRLDRLLPAARELAMVLREVARAGFVAPAHAPRIGRQLADGDLEQRRLADPVRPDDREAIAPFHLERDVLEHLVVAVRLADPRKLE